MSATRILGIDPGSRITGYGVVDFDHDRPRHVASGALAVHGDDLGGRLAAIFDALNAVIGEHDPSEMAVERVYLHRNPSAALKLGQARGVALLCGVNRGLSIHEYAPSEIKLAVVGRGQATKEQVQHMVRVLLALPRPPAEDAADALAAAICHGHVRTTTARIAAAAARAGARR
jgi:crossover junction endodeoxyribonuclease RuvC